MLAELAATNKQVSEFLLDPTIFDTFEKIAATYGLPVERTEEFFDLTEAVMERQIALTDVPTVLTEAFAIPSDQAQKAAADLVGHRLLPLANFLPGIERQIKEWGGDLAQYPVVRISKEKVSASKFVEQLQQHAKITLPENALKRLSFLLWEVMRGKRTTDQFGEFLTRRTNAGGLGLEPSVAQKLFTQVLAEKDNITLVDEDALSPHAIPQKKPSRVAQATPAAPAEAVVFEQEDLREAKRKAAAIQRQVQRDPKELIIEAVQVAVEAAKPVLGTTTMSEKLFADVAEKAIRGLRDIYQTRDVLEQGNKLSGTVLTGLLGAVKEGIEKYHTLGGPLQPAARVEEEPATDAGLDRKYAKLTHERSTETVEDLMPGARVSASRTAAEEQSQRTKRLDLNQNAAERPAPARAELTVGSVPLAEKNNGQRKVVDIVSANRLMGPVEQLGAMTPAEFRRLSTNPAEAGQRIEDLIGSLASTSYEERIKGIEAWRQSPMNQMYLTMAEEALAQGLSIPEIGSRRRAAGQESLSPAEIKAVTTLNARVRF